MVNLFPISTRCNLSANPGGNPITNWDAGPLFNQSSGKYIISETLSTAVTRCGGSGSAVTRTPSLINATTSTSCVVRLTKCMASKAEPPHTINSVCGALSNISCSFSSCSAWFNFSLSKIFMSLFSLFYSDISDICQDYYRLKVPFSAVFTTVHSTVLHRGQSPLFTRPKGVIKLDFEFWILELDVRLASSQFN